MGMVIKDGDLSLTQVSVFSMRTISRAISRACSLQDAPDAVIHLSLSELTKTRDNIDLL